MIAISRVTIGLALLLSAGWIRAGNAIEFSADLKEFTGEGIVYHRLIFKDNEQSIYFQPPPGWACTLIGKSLHLRPSDKNFAVAEINSAALTAPQPFTEATTQALAQEVLTNLPPASQQAALVRQEQNPILLNNNQSFEVVVSYKGLGDNFERSVLFVNTPTNQLVFRLTARKSDFDALYRAFRSSISSWEWQEPPAVSNR